MYNNNSVLFDCNQNSYAFDTENLVFCQLDEQTKNVFDYYNENGEFPAENPMSPNVKVYADNGYFFDESNADEYFEYSADYVSLSFPPVHECNFRCRYCFAGGGENYTGKQQQFTRDKIDKMLQYVYDVKFSESKQFRFDFVSGGEPLLNFEIMQYFIDRVKEIDVEKGVKTTFFVVTNGTLLNENILRYFDSHNVDLGISIDGDRQLHDLQRPYKDGRGSYDDVIKAIKMIQGSNCSVRMKDIWALTVVTKNTKSLKDVLEHHAGLGIKRAQLKILRSDGQHPLGFTVKDLPELKNNYAELNEYLRSKIDDDDTGKLLMILNDNDTYGKIIRRLLLREKVVYRCGAGKNKISFSASGDYYPCDSFCGMPEFFMGNIEGNERYAAGGRFYAASIYGRPRCRACWAKNLCGGDCYHNSYLKNHDIMEPDPVICEMNQFFIQEAVDLLCYLYNHSPAFVTRLVKNLRKRARMA